MFIGLILMRTNYLLDCNYTLINAYLLVRFFWQCSRSGLLSRGVTLKRTRAIISLHLEVSSLSRHAQTSTLQGHCLHLWMNTKAIKRQPGDMCPEHINWLFIVEEQQLYSKDLRLTKILILRLSPATFLRKLILIICMCSLIHTQSINRQVLLFHSHLSLHHNRQHLHHCKHH